MILPGPDPKVETHSSAGTGRVCDIGLAREAQRFRRRAVMRPVPIQRRANVIRFGEQKIQVMRAEERVRVLPWQIQPDDPGDSPTAA